MELVHQLDITVDVVYDGAFRNLDLEQFLGQLVLIRQMLDVLRYVDGEEIDLRNIDGDGNRIVSVADPAAQPAAPARGR